MKPTAVELCLALSLAQSRLALVVDEALGIHHGLSLRELALLDHLQRATSGAMPLRALATALATPLSTTLRQALPLEKTGLIDRTPQGLALRPAGARVLKQARATADEAGHDALAMLPADDRLRLMTLLRALATGHTSAGAPA